MGQLTLLGRRVVQPTREWGMVATSRSHAHVMLLLKQYCRIRVQIQYYGPMKNYNHQSLFC